MKKGWHQREHKRTSPQGVLFKAGTAEPKHFPRPDYDRCNAGHQLVEVYDDRRNRFTWDCPICIEKMRKAGGGFGR
jgi:hypothetical protein